MRQNHNTATDWGVNYWLGSVGKFLEEVGLQLLIRILKYNEEETEATVGILGRVT